MRHFLKLDCKELLSLSRHGINILISGPLQIINAFLLVYIIIVYAHEVLRVILVKLFNSFLNHCFTPHIFSSVIFLHLLKDERKSADDVNNYRPIAITSILSKLFESCLSDFLSPYLISHFNQLGFVKHGGCNKAILALKTVLTYFINNESPVFICTLDAKKTFDRINHYNFLTVLINRGAPKNIIMLFYKWISSLSFCVLKKNILFCACNISSGFLLGNILSPKFFDA